MSLPNLLWIMADDLGVGEPSFTTMPTQNSTHGRIATPHIDMLAGSGMSFSGAYAGYTVCAPSRTTLFTGRNSGHFATSMPQDWPVLPKLLKAGGYETAVFGKSAPMDHVSAQGKPGTLNWGNPTHFGFDAFSGQPDQGLCHNMYPATINDGTSVVNLTLNTEKEKSRELCMAEPEAYNYTTDLFADHAMAWLRGRKSKKPYFLYLSFTVPHAGGWGSAPNQPEQGNPVPVAMG